MKRDILLAATFVLLAGTSNAATPTYTIVDLGAQRATDVNNRGDVVGSDASGRAILYSQGAIYQLGVLPGMTYSIPLAINDDGQIVGASYSMSRPSLAFIYQDGAMQLAVPGIAESSATAINDKGEFAGYFRTSTGSYRAFTSFGAEVVDLGTLYVGTDSFANGINSLGQVVGNLGSQSGLIRAFFYSPDVGMQDFGVRGAAREINDLGQVVGWYDVAGEANSHGFVFSGGTMYDIGGLPGGSTLPNDINNAGDIVGMSAFTAFLYSEGELTDLNTLVANADGWVLRDATAINDAGLIVGYGRHDGIESAFLLTPIPPIPEPSPASLFVIGALAFGVWRSHARRRLSSGHGTACLITWRADS